MRPRTRFGHQMKEGAGQKPSARAKSSSKVILLDRKGLLQGPLSPDGREDSIASRRQVQL